MLFSLFFPRQLQASFAWGISSFAWGEPVLSWLAPRAMDTLSLFCTREPQKTNTLKEGGGKKDPFSVHHTPPKLPQNPPPKTLSRSDCHRGLCQDGEPQAWTEPRSPPFAPGAFRNSRAEGSGAEVRGILGLVLGPEILGRKCWGDVCWGVASWGYFLGGGFCSNLAAPGINRRVQLRLFAFWVV